MSRAGREILLVFPGKYGAPVPGMPVVLPVLGGVLQRRGISVRLLDMRVDRLTKPAVGRPLCVGISAMTGHQVSCGLDAARLVRAVDPSIPVVWGGVHPSMLPAQTAASPLADIVVHGEGEETFPELVRRLETGAPLGGVKGIAFKGPGGNIEVAPPREFIDLDDLPVELPYGQLRMERYRWQIFVQTSRGCPHDCGFCYNAFYSRGVFRRKSTGRILDELAYVTGKFRPAEIGFDCDDGFFTDQNGVRELCEGMIRRKFSFSWTAPARFDYFERYDADFIRLLARSGCRGLTFGGDSGSARIQARIGKGFGPDVPVRALENMRRCAGTAIAVDVNFIAGFPGETRDDFAATARLMDELSRVYPRIRYGMTIFTPYPGTPLYGEALRSPGFVPPDSLEAWGGYDFGEFRAPWLERGYSRFLRTLAAVSRVDFFSSDYEVPARFGAFPDKLMYRMFSALGHARWRSGFFRIPWEWDILRAYVKARRGYF